jgi:HD-like signal output (HDOD) protein/nitrogen-specific signal transduction histidine kinase
MHKLPDPILQAIESGRVPSPPQLLLRLLQMVDDDQSTMGDLASLVRQDPGLSTRVLSIANSPALRRGSELISIENCLIALGTRMVRSIATCLSIQNLFERRSGVSEADLSGFWVHSLIVAELSRNLAVSAGLPQPEEAYLAGLLHDVGELILLSALGEPYAQLLASTADEDALQAKESAQFGVHHGEIGTWLTDQWHLDSSFADGILFHHARPEEIATAAALPQIVWLAHALAAREEIAPELTAFHQQIFNPPADTDLAGLREQAERQTRQIAEALGLMPPERICARQVWQTLPVKAEQASAESPAESELSSMIGGMALLQPLQQDLFALESDAEVLLSLKESARILFDLNRLAFLLYNPTEKSLSGASLGDQPAIFRQVKIQPEEHRSLVAAAAQKRQIQCSFDPEATPPAALIDQQFARSLGAAGLLCIPMIGRNRIAGVMLCGLSQAQYSRLSRRLPWLLNFGRIAAISLDSLQEARNYRQQAEQEAASRFSQQARRVIHEAGNPLGIIKSYLRILGKKLPEEAGVRQELEVLNEEIDRVAGIVGRMSEIPSDRTPASGLDVGELINELALLYGDALFQSRGIRFELTQPPESLRVKCDRDSLKQILLNLWKNASEALVSGQQVRISLTDHVIHVGQAYIQVRMDDNGPGMSDATMYSIHRPAAASPAGPRGIGLSIVGSLATRQGIPITCRSQPGKGTSIALLLPKYEAKASAADSNSRTSNASSGQACGVIDT